MEIWEMSFMIPADQKDMVEPDLRGRGQRQTMLPSPVLLCKRIWRPDHHFYEPSGLHDEKQPGLPPIVPGR